MTTVKTLQRSFAHGEITPELYGRIDLVQYQTGLAECLNFWALPHGPAANRPGFAYVNEIKDSTAQARLIPFQYSTDQSYELEFGNEYIRIHALGETVLEATKSVLGITQANPAVANVTAHGYATGDWVYIGGDTGMSQIDGEFYKITVVDADHFSLARLDGTAVDSTLYTASNGDGTCARPLEVSGTVPYLTADLFDLHHTQSADVITICHPSYAPREITRNSATSWSIALVSFAPTISAPNAPTVSKSGSGSSPVTLYYATTALKSGTLEESSLSASGSVSADLVGGDKVTITTATVTGAVRYNVYRLFNGIWGYIGQTDGSAFVDDNITPDVSQTPPIIETPFASAGDYPSAVGYYGGRRWFGGTTNEPQGLWATRSGTESSMAYSIPTRSDDRIWIDILSGQIDTIRHFAALGSPLVFTAGGEYKLAADNTDVLTPTSTDPKPQSAEGLSNVMPVKAGSALLGVDVTGSRMMEITYRWDQGENGAYTAEDISLFAMHLFDNYTITDLAYVRKPYKMAFAVRSDGRLLGLTYYPAQKIVSWHQHETNGSFESVCSVQESTEWPLYAIVKRTINGRTVRYIERQKSRLFTSQADAFFVDAGATYTGAALASHTISNLWFLEGEAVSVLCNGSVISGLTVTNGQITLPDEAAQLTSNTVHVGLGYNSDLQTLPLSMDGVQAFGQDRYISVNSVQFRVNQSSTIFAGPSFSSLREYKQRSSEPYGSPPALKTGQLKPLSIGSSWETSGQVCVRNTDPVPLEITSMILEVAVGG